MSPSVAIFHDHALLRFNVSSAIDFSGGRPMVRKENKKEQSVL